MSQMDHAVLKEITNGALSSDLSKDFPVQFNPTSLKVNLSRSITGNKSDTHRSAQDAGLTDATLSVDLIFDTAEEGTTDQPVSVLPRIEALMELAKVGKNRTGSSNSKTIAFIFGDFIFAGYITSMNVEYDLFAQQGTPLHAKVSLSMQYQEPPPNDSSQTSGGLGQQVGVALGGESLAGFSARMGLEPAGWRGLAAGIQNPLSLSAGLEINLGSALLGEGGLGVTAGLEVNLGAAPELLVGLSAARGSVGLDAGVGLSGGLRGPVPGLDPSAGPSGSGLTAQTRAGGRALAGAGGLRSAIDALDEVHGSSTAAATRRSFVTPPPAGAQSSAGSNNPIASSAPPRPMRREQDRTPLSRAAGTRLPDPKPLQPPVQVDRRAVTYGQGVPLRPRPVQEPPPVRATVPARPSGAVTYSRTSGSCGCGGTCGGCGGTR